MKRQSPTPAASNVESVPQVVPHTDAPGLCRLVLKFVKTTSENDISNGPDAQNSGVHYRLERPLPPFRLDQIS